MNYTIAKKVKQNANNNVNCKFNEKPVKKSVIKNQGKSNCKENQIVFASLYSNISSLFS